MACPRTDLGAVLFVLEDTILHTAKVTKKRQHFGAKVAWPIFLESNRKIIHGETINISSDAAFIRCQEALEPGEVIELSISVPFPSSPIRTIAEVVQSENLGSDAESLPVGTIVQFMIISDEDRKFISSFVSDQLKSKDLDWRQERSSQGSFE
jgi:hypothetical protein